MRYSKPKGDDEPSALLTFCPYYRQTYSGRFYYHPSPAISVTVDISYLACLSIRVCTPPPYTHCIAVIAIPSGQRLPIGVKKRRLHLSRCSRYVLFSRFCYSVSFTVRFLNSQVVAMLEVLTYLKPMCMLLPAYVARLAVEVM